MDEGELSAVLDENSFQQPLYPVTVSRVEACEGDEKEFMHTHMPEWKMMQEVYNSTNSSGDSLCRHWLLKGSCRYGSSCRYEHMDSLVRMTNKHHHSLGPDMSSKRKRFFCDCCGLKSKERYRCVDGCDFDLCISCFAASSPRIVEDLQVDKCHRVTPN
mmetsp:Transcript_13588/g.20388  ORF Transcript_13588/g.20388 Transcript_13588/m.20388 type:complete len:159 (-) Transcript_13588:188-664(-)